MADQRRSPTQVDVTRRAEVSRMLGLYTFEPAFPVRRRDFYFPFLLGVEGATAAYGHDLLLFSSAGPEGNGRIYADGVNRLKVADGCVLLGRHLHRDDLAQLTTEDFPFVFVGRREVPGVELSYVAADYVGATSHVVRNLARLGHRRLAYLGIPGDQEPSRDRAEGLRRGLAEAGIPNDQVVVHLSQDTITGTVLAEWLAAGITALLVEPTENDSAIVEVERAAAEAGIRIPEDCSVVLLGDPPFDDPAVRDWTRFSVPREEMGREAVRLLLGLLDDEDGQPRWTYLACTQIAGDSVAEPPAGAASPVWPEATGC
jgi:DNA-binding LacI/PurR family transcriptional regulator